MFFVFVFGCVLWLGWASVVFGVRWWAFGWSVGGAWGCCGLGPVWPLCVGLAGVVWCGCGAMCCEGRGAGGGGGGG
ncbi:hypothetical protein, partial [Pseudomonas syringae group genomosp. 7]|uniref:hypothetical protein n=1 Tax=Pseudomonas syringae group genomosp. 7 TaxID=251699 RepID=UPI00376FA58D